MWNVASVGLWVKSLKLLNQFWPASNRLKGLWVNLKLLHVCHQCLACCSPLRQKVSVTSGRLVIKLSDRSEQSSNERLEYFVLNSDNINPMINTNPDNSKGWAYKTKHLLCVGWAKEGSICAWLKRSCTSHTGSKDNSLPKMRNLQFRVGKLVSTWFLSGAIRLVRNRPIRPENHPTETILLNTVRYLSVWRNWLAILRM